jgi:hypothetical protein
LKPPSEQVRAPQGAVAWTPELGWVFAIDSVPTMIREDQYIVLVSPVDGRAAPIPVNQLAPLIAVMRLDTELIELRWKLIDTWERAEDDFTEHGKWKRP